MSFLIVHQRLDLGNTHSSQTAPAQQEFISLAFAARKNAPEHKSAGAFIDKKDTLL
jgi:hypothetical protein